MVVGLPAVAAAIAQGWAVSAAMDGIWRQPEALGGMRSALIIGLAFMEALAIYGLLVAFMLLGKF